MIYKALISIACVLQVFAALAQPSFTARVDTNRILIGQQLQLKLHSEMPANANFIWPALPDTLSGLEVIKEGPIDTAASNGRWTIVQSLHLTSFDSGYAVVPPLTLESGGQNISSEAIGIAIAMPEVAESEDYYDIKSPLDVPFNWWPMMWVVLSALLLIAGIWILIKYVRQRKHEQTLTPEQKLSPYEYAQLQIRELKEEKLWQNGQVKEYYSRLTDIMRLFMEHQLGLNAMERTADEVVEQTRELSLSEELQYRVEELMRLSVLVKYAKEAPGAEDHTTSMQTVANFIERHRPLEDTQTNEKMTGKPRIT